MTLTDTLKHIRLVPHGILLTGSGQVADIHPRLKSRGVSPLTATETECPLRLSATPVCPYTHNCADHDYGGSCDHTDDYTNCDRYHNYACGDGVGDVYLSLGIRRMTE